MGWIGSTLASISGADHSARQNFNYSMDLQKQNQAWQTQMANTAHQREMADLKAAGLNPVMAAGGDGAATGSPGGTSVSGTPAGDPIGALLNISTTAKSFEKTDAEINEINANKGLVEAQAWKILKETEPNINKIIQERNLITQQINESKTREEKEKAEKNLIDWQNKHPVASRVLSGALPAAANVAGAWVTGRALQMGQSARAKAAKQPKVDGGKIYTSAPIYPDINPIY